MPNSKKKSLWRTYRDFASAFGTTWLLVIGLAFLTGGRIGRWGGWILPMQILLSLAYAAWRTRRRHASRRPGSSADVAGPRFVPI